MTPTTGDNLKRAMEAKGVSVTELSERTGLSISTVYRMLDGSMKGHLDSWVKVSECLGVSLDELVW